MIIHLGPEQERVVREGIAGGRYEDEEQVLTEALTLLEARDRLEQLRASLRIGWEQIERGETVPYSTELMEQLKREAHEDVLAATAIPDDVKP